MMICMAEYENQHISFAEMLEESLKDLEREEENKVEFIIVADECSANMSEMLNTNEEICRLRSEVEKLVDGIKSFLCDCQQVDVNCDEECESQEYSEQPQMLQEDDRRLHKIVRNARKRTVTRKKYVRKAGFAKLISVRVIVRPVPPRETEIVKKYLTEVVRRARRKKKRTCFIKDCDRRISICQNIYLVIEGCMRKKTGNLIRSPMETNQNKICLCA